MLLLGWLLWFVWTFKADMFVWHSIPSGRELCGRETLSLKMSSLYFIPKNTTETSGFKLYNVSFHLFCMSHFQVGARCSSVIRAFTHGAMGRRIDPSWVDPLSYFSFQPVINDWCNKGSGMCYPVCVMVHIKEPLLLIGKSSPCGGSGFPLTI